jgi:tetratricopeptide (TPR) repeat protein
MKKIIYTIIVCLTFAYASDLPAYVAKYDKSLAIELYEEELRNEKDLGKTYQALAGLYNETGEFGLAEDCYRHLLEIYDGSDKVYRSYLEFLYQNQYHDKLRYIIQTNNFDQSWSQFLLASSYFKEGLFDSSLSISTILPEEIGGKLKRYSIEGLELKPRSPALGGILSAIIPGTGKIYAGRLLDGMQAFSVVLAPAYNAYYHFSKTGTSSVQAWIWTAVASWFYLSDIYGSVKAVIEYNDMQKYKIIERYEQ